MTGEEFTLVPRGPFSLEAAAGFGFGGRLGAPAWDGTMRLAFAVDGFEEHAGVILREDEAGIHGEVHGAQDMERVSGQIARVLSLDYDGGQWLRVGERDPVMGELQASHPGLRPVLFHSPYEAAAWSVISARRRAQQAAEVRRRISQEIGESFDLAGREMAAFPLPDRLLARIKPMPGLPVEKVERLRGVAAAASAGELDPKRLAECGPDEAMAVLQELRGIGPFYAALIVNRAAGLSDVLPVAEPRVLACAAHFYGLAGRPGPEAFTKLAEPWRPFRTWAAVLCGWQAIGLSWADRQPRGRVRRYRQSRQRRPNVRPSPQWERLKCKFRARRVPKAGWLLGLS